MTTYTETRRGFTARPHKEQIKLAMSFYRLTNAELALRAKVAPSTIGNILGTKRDTCNPETAAKIAQALGMGTERLFTLEQIEYAS